MMSIKPLRTAVARPPPTRLALKVHFTSVVKNEVVIEPAAEDGRTANKLLMLSDHAGPHVTMSQLLLTNNRNAGVIYTLLSGTGLGSGSLELPSSRSFTTPPYQKISLLAINMSHGSLKEAYTLAHSAQCRLSMEANRPERNLRFVVGHLMHYENLRLRIVEIEHDMSKRENAQVAFRGTGHVDRLQKKPSTGQLGRKKSPPPPPLDDDSSDEEDDDPWSGGEDDEGGDDLSLTRFPSGAAKAPRPPELVPDDEDDDEPSSPEEPDQKTLEELLKTKGSPDLANMYNGVKKCPCHGRHDSQDFEQMWELPRQDGQKEGVTRAVAQMFV